jgi:hypothetical protein
MPATTRTELAPAALFGLVALAGCASVPEPRAGLKGTTEGNPLGPSYMLMPLPTEDDALLGRMVPEVPEPGRTLEEIARANPCGDKLTQKKETRLASTYEYAEELAAGAKAEAALGAFGFKAEGGRATHFVYKLKTDRRAAVTDTVDYDKCCKEAGGCGYGYVSSLVYGTGEYATGEETSGSAGVNVVGVGSASGSVALKILNKRQVKGWVAVVITVTDPTKKEHVGPLGIAQAAGITETTIAQTVRAVYDGEKMAVVPQGESYVFQDGRGRVFTENQFVEKYEAVTGSDELSGSASRSSSRPLRAMARPRTTRWTRQPPRFTSRSTTVRS